MNVGGHREFETTLPVGYRDPAGRVHRRVVLRKLTGHEEALFYDASLTAARLTTEIIKGCTLRLGDLTEVSGEVATGLFSADRNYLLVELRRITLGDELRASYACPACKEENSVVENLGNLTVRRIPEGESPVAIPVVLVDGYRDRDGIVHKEVTLRLPRGTDEEHVSRTAETDLLRARDAFLLRCVESFGTLPKSALEAYGIKILRELTLGDRRRIYEALDRHAPGVDFRRRLVCSACSAPFEAVLEASGFFVNG